MMLNHQDTSVDNREEMRKTFYFRIVHTSAASQTPTADRHTDDTPRNTSIGHVGASPLNIFFQNHLIRVEKQKTNIQTCKSLPHHMRQQ